MVTQENAFCSAYCTKGEILCHLEFKLHQQQKDMAQKRNCFNQLLNLLGYMKVHYTVSSIFMFALIKKKKNQNFDQIVSCRQPLSPEMPPSLPLLTSIPASEYYLLSSLNTTTF